MNSEEFDGLLAISRAHPVFKKDWATYQSLDFADTFLPYVQGHKATAMYVFDGGNLFTNTQPADKRVLPLSNNKELITTIGYTYPKGVPASEKRETATPANHELLIFMEVDMDDSVQVSFKTGNNFKKFLQKYPNARSINDTYTTDISTIQNYFSGELLQENTLQYVLDTLGIAFNLFEQEFLFYLENALEDFVLFDKYTPYVVVRRTQQEVLDETQKVQPNDDEIYIWLVSEDYIHFDTNFIILQIGKSVGKDFNERTITEKFLSQFILDTIKAEIQLDVFSTKLVSKQTSKFLSQASFAAAISKDIKSNPQQEKLFKQSPDAYLGIKALTYFTQQIEQYTIPSNRWMSNDPKYDPLLSSDIMENAFACGLINGIINSLKGIPEGLAFFWEIHTDPKKFEEFVKSIQKLLEEENLVELIVKGAIDGYQKAERPEELAYEFGKDIIAVVEIVLGIITFFEGGGISNFINGTKNVLRYLKRFGKKGIKNLKKLKKPEIKELFDRLDNINKNVDSVRLNKLELDEWKKAIAKLGGQIRKYTDDADIKKYFDIENPDVGAAFQADKIPPTIWIRQDATDLELFHESLHFEDYLRRGNDYLRGQKRKLLPFGNKDKIPERDQLISKYIKEKYVLDKILEEQENWIKKFGKGRFTEQEIEFSIDYFSGYSEKITEAGIDINKILIKE